MTKDDCLFRSVVPEARDNDANENIWIVPLSEMTEIMLSGADSVAEADGGGGGGENAIEWISALSTPRRSSTKHAQVRVSHIRTSVPCREADARTVPE